jgi:hypothetical protein
LKRAWVAVVVVGLAASACSSPSQSASVDPTTNPPTTISASPSCIDSGEVTPHLTAAEAHLTKVSRDANNFDLNGAVEQLRLAASEVRAVADALGSLNPEAEKHLLRAADAYDQAASAYNALDTSNGTSYFSQGNHEVKLAASSLTSVFC